MNVYGSYVVVEFMIRERKVTLFELKHLGDSLERQSLITQKEQHALIRLGNKLLPKLPIEPAK